VNYSSEGKEKVDGNKPPNNIGKSKKAKRNKHKKNKFKDQSSGRGKRSFKHHCCGDPNHIVKKCNILQHLVDIYQKSLKEMKKLKDRMKLTSMQHLMMLQLWTSVLMKLQSQG
jgi:hypothetical protein